MNINVNVISPEKVSSSARRRYESQVCDAQVHASRYLSGPEPVESLWLLSAIETKHKTVEGCGTRRRVTFSVYCYF